MKKFLTVLSVLVLILSVFAGCGKADAKEIRFGVLKGPTGIGAAYLMEQDENGKALNNYEFTVSAAPTDMVSALAAGELDMAAVPTNVACALYNKLSGGVQIAALNTAGVLYILENGNSVNSVADLKGKTLYATGKGSNPEFVLNYILESNGIEPEKDIKVEYLDSEELATRAAAGDIDLCMLPVPNVTSVMLKNKDMRKALDLSAEWDKTENGGILTMGCVVVRTDFAKENKKAVENFLKEYEQSINYAKDNPEKTGELCEKYGIVGAAAIGTKAIPDCNLIFVKGDEISKKLEGYYNVLYEADPTSVGGKLPAEDFYFIG